MSKHLWIINHYASRPGEAGVRHYSLARALQAHGWDTTILAASTQHSTRTQRVAGWRRYMTESFDGVTFRWFHVPSYGQSGVLRVLNMVAFLFAISLPRSTRGLQKPDAIVGSSVHPLAALGAAFLARRKKVPFYFEIRDLWPETLIQMGALKRNGAGARLMRSLERFLCARARAVITTMPFAHEYLSAHGVPRDKIVWISNGVNVEDFDSAPKVDESEFVFVYFGALGSANCVDVLIDAFAGLGENVAARLRIVGSGPAEAALQNQIHELGIGHRVSMEGRIPKDEIAHLAAESDCLVVGLLPLPLYEFGISLNKLYEYMAAARPIVFSGLARGNPIELSGGGICAVGVSETTAAMRTVILTEVEQRACWGRLNRIYVEENFDFRSLGSKLACVLD